MTSRNLSEVFLIMRNNATKNRNHYIDDKRGSDAERLLKHNIRDAEEGLELQDDYGTSPIWIDKLEEAQYTMSKIKPKLDELGSLHARHLLRPTFDEKVEEEDAIEILSQEISKLITSTHRHIQCIRSSLGIGSKLEQRLTANAVTCLLLQLQELTSKFRSSQNIYVGELNLREERSKKYFDSDEFTNVILDDTPIANHTTDQCIDINNDDDNVQRNNFVDTFDNFLQPQDATATANNTYLYEDQTTQQDIDEHFQKPIAHRLTQKQLLLFEEENARLAQRREEEVVKIVKSIYDLNDIFKDLGQMVHEQGTVLDRIDYNIEQTQTRVTEGLRQLQRAEMYQRKNRKMCIILVLAIVTLTLLLLLIVTKL